MISTRTSNQKRAQAIMQTITRVTADLPAVERNLDDSLAGWPTAEGTTPSSTRGTTSEDTTGTEDRARIDRDRLTKLLKVINHATTEADNIRLRWARPRLDGTTVEQRIAAADELIWCASCIRQGIRNVRTHGTRCEFCAGIHADHGIDPPKKLLEIHGYRKINAADVAKHMTVAKRDAKKGRK